MVHFENARTFVAPHSVYRLVKSFRLHCARPTTLKFLAKFDNEKSQMLVGRKEYFANFSYELVTNVLSITKYKTFHLQFFSL